MKKKVLDKVLLIVLIVFTTIITNKIKVYFTDLKNENKELIGQGAPTMVSHYLNASSPTQYRHYTLGVEMDGEGANSSAKEGHKVAIYGAAETGKKGNPDIWAANFLAQVDSGLPFKDSEGVNAQGIEVDVNNNQGDYYSTWDWDRGNAVGINVTSGGLYPISSGIRVGSTKSTNYPAYGIIIDSGTKKSGMLFLGNHPVGIDFTNANINDAIVLKENQSISIKDESGNINQLLTPDKNGFVAMGTNYKVLTSPPNNPDIGLVVYADGVKWNPGSGEGLYIFKSTGWILIK